MCERIWTLPCALLRRHRARVRDGRRVFALDLDVVMVEEMLIREDLLPAGAEHDPKVVDAVLAKFIEKLAEWRPPSPETGFIEPSAPVLSWRHSHFPSVRKAQP